MSFASLATLTQLPLRILLICPEREASLTLAGLLQPLQMAAKALGPARLQLESMPLESALEPGLQASAWPGAQLCLLVSDDALAGLRKEQGRILLERCQRAPVWPHATRASIGPASTSAAKPGASSSVALP